MKRATHSESIFLFDREVVQTYDHVPYQPCEETALNHLVPVVTALARSCNQRVHVRHGPVIRGTPLWEMIAADAPGTSGVYQPAGVERALVADTLHAVQIMPGAGNAVGILLSDRREPGEEFLNGFLGWFDLDEPVAPADSLPLYAWAEGDTLTLEKVPVPRYLRRWRPWARAGFSVRWEARAPERPAGRVPRLEVLHGLNQNWARLADLNLAAS
jgi:hypothetical protein